MKTKAVKAHGSVIVPCDITGCPNSARWYYPKPTLFGWNLCDTCKDTDRRGVDCLPLDHNGNCVCPEAPQPHAQHVPADAPEPPPAPIEPTLAKLRNAGWMVAVHNDYRQHGRLMTFWLFVRNGIAVKGEGYTDDEALAQVMKQVEGR